MNIIVLFSLSILFFTRMIGFGVSFDIYRKERDVKFLYITMGWAVWLLANITAFLTAFEQNVMIDLIIASNAMFALVGMVLMVIGIVEYFSPIHSRVIISIVGMFVIVPMLLFVVFGASVSVMFSSGSFYLIILYLTISTIINRENYLKVFKSGVVWFRLLLAWAYLYFLVNIILVVTFPDYSYGYYFSNNEPAILINYFLATGLSILFLVFFIHLQHIIAAGKTWSLKDKYSHELGNLLQITYGHSHFLRHDSLSEDHIKRLELLEDSLDKANSVLREIRKI